MGLIDFTHAHSVFFVVTKNMFTNNKKLRI